MLTLVRRNFHSSSVFFKKSFLDYSKFPALIDEEIEETFVRGSGPGGQAVNKTSNCVVLRHKPTNILVKCHIHRVVSENQKEARKILLNKLDALYNGEDSIEAQEKRFSDRKSSERNRRQKKANEMKKKWKESNESLE